MKGLRFSLSAILIVAASAEAGQGPVRVVEGRAVTGINRRLGQPVFDLGAPFGTIGFETLGAFSANGAEPLPLTPASPPGTLLATAVDPTFLAVFGVPPESFDPALANVPLREIGSYVAPDGSRASLPSHRAAAQLAPSKAVSNGPLTLREWLRARGTATIRCSGPGSPRIDLAFRGLVPRGLYTAWGGMLTPDGPMPVALGGVPNAFAADLRGRASFTAYLNYCPLALRSGEVPLAFIDVVLHSDHAVYAAVPELFAAGFPPGLVTQIHVEFVVDAEPVR